MVLLRIYSKKNFKDIFKSIYTKREEKRVYLKDVVIYLRAAYENIDDNMQVNLTIMNCSSIANFV